MPPSSRGATPRTNPPPPPRLLGGMLWLLTGVLIGGVLTWLWCAVIDRPATACASSVSAASHASEADNGDGSATPTPTPHFDFYNILSHQPPVATTTPGTPTHAPAPTPTPAPTPAPVASPPPTAVTPPATATEEVPTPHEHTAYILQSGSFHTRAEADQRRAQILMLGLSATIQTVPVDGLSAWYRVITGPFQDAATAAAAKERLQKQGIVSIGMRKKP